MCLAKPGRRCTIYTKAHLATTARRLVAARSRLDENLGARSEDSARAEVARAERAVVMARTLDDATAEQRDWLAGRLEVLEADDPQRSAIAHRYAAAQLFVHERKNAVALMPDTQPQTRAGRAAYEELGRHRERLALLHTHATLADDGTWDEEISAEERAAFDAEVAYRIAEAGGEADRDYCFPSEDLGDSDVIADSHRRAVAASGAYPSPTSSSQAKAPTQRPRRSGAKLELRRRAARSRQALKAALRDARAVGEEVLPDASARSSKLIDAEGMLPSQV